MIKFSQRSKKILKFSQPSNIKSKLSREQIIEIRKLRHSINASFNNTLKHKEHSFIQQRNFNTKVSVLQNVIANINYQFPSFNLQYLHKLNKKAEKINKLINNKYNNIILRSELVDKKIKYIIKGLKRDNYFKKLPQHLRGNIKNVENLNDLVKGNISRILILDKNKKYNYNDILGLASELNRTNFVYNNDFNKLSYQDFENIGRAKTLVASKIITIASKIENISRNIWDSDVEQIAERISFFISETFANEINQYSYEKLVRVLETIDKKHLETILEAMDTGIVIVDGKDNLHSVKAIINPGFKFRKALLEVLNKNHF